MKCIESAYNAFKIKSKKSFSVLSKICVLNRIKLKENNNVISVTGELDIKVGQNSPCPGHPKHLVEILLLRVFCIPLLPFILLLGEGKSCKQPGDSEEVSKEY